jgi:ring-1,2-phenylacetyl-CoA epoxidase subunit PaaC
MSDLLQGKRLVNDIEKTRLADYLLALGDDELILGHRNSEWCGHAPILEEDIAFANIALDEIGHATLWYSCLAELLGEDPQRYPDRVVFFRHLDDFRNAPLVELPKGDWAFSMLRQYLFDEVEKIRLGGLASSTYEPLAAAAQQVRKEEFYHYRHTRAWVKRLGLGTEESHSRLQRALEDLWPYIPEIFRLTTGEEELVSAGIVPNDGEVAASWRGEVFPFLQECGLRLPMDGLMKRGDGQETRADFATPPGESVSPLPRRTKHSPHLKVLVTEMQSVARSDPRAEW